MEPTEIYNKSKRNLAVFVGLLVLVMAGGSEAKSQSQLLPFKISRPDVIQHVIFVIALYSSYQYWLSWQFQRDELRKRFWYDPLIVYMLTSTVFISYVRLYWQNTIEELTGANLWIIGVVLLISYAMASALWVYAELRVSLRKLYSLRQNIIDERILHPGWMLNFNPRSPNGTKSISFEDDGTIGEGRNKNEDHWQLRDGLLEIWRASGELQNRFKYDKTTDRFLCTNDPEAKGYRDQVIYREQR